MAHARPVNSFTGHNLLCVRGQRMVFHKLDFSVRSGDALLLTGPNGSGKSTLLRCMAGLLRPVEGQLRWNGAAITEEPEAHRRRLHFLGHADAVKPTLSVEENLRFWARMRSGVADQPGAADSLRGALVRFGIEPLADLPARLLSAGQRRRLALARLLATPAPLWLLDEPTTALDTAGVGQLVDAIAAQRVAGGSVVLSSHDDLGLPQAARLSLSDFAPAVLEADSP
jgi:heme exporter protein A